MIPLLKTHEGLVQFARQVPDMRAPEMCGVIKNDGKTKWFPRTDEVRGGMSLVSFETLK